MPTRNNPFKPTQPVFTGMFAGRINEIKRIETILCETKESNPTNLLIVGERGIGKTSLLLLMRTFAQGGIPCHGEKLDFLTIFVSLDRRTFVADLARKMNTAMERGLRDSGEAIQFLRDAWSFVQRLQVSGIKLGAKASVTNEAEVFENFTYSILDTVKALISEESASSKLGLVHPKDGLVIFIDEVDNAPEELDLGTLVKQLSENLVAEDCNKVLFVLAGCPEIRNVLIKSHASAPRLFEELELTPLSGEDSKWVITQGLEEANKNNSEPVKITDEALNRIVAFSEGYPHFVQQFGYSSYAIDKDNSIDLNDVNTAAYAAFKNIGDRYYKDMYFNKIKENSYRQVLKIMSEKWNEWVSKKEIRSNFKGTGSTLNNALKALADRNVILRKPGTRGEYRLQWLGFAFWIKVFAEKLEGEIRNYNGISTSTGT